MVLYPRYRFEDRAFELSNMFYALLCGDCSIVLQEHHIQWRVRYSCEYTRG